MFLPPDMLAGIARERQATMLAEAESDRRARQARLAARQVRRAGRQARRAAAPHPWPGFWLARRWRPVRWRAGTVRPLGQPARLPVTLRDGSQVVIRPVVRSDAALLADGFGRLSDQSRRMRFLRPKDQLTPSELRYFTDVDHRDHEALGALDHGDGRGVGIARYIRQADDPAAAEIAVTVIDDWQGRGLGSELLARLADRACQEGIRKFVALVATDNTAMTGLLENVSADVVHREVGTLTYELALGCAQLSGPGCAPLRAS
jgi:RimJ/RimL family protein N-acetyltransferase